MPLRIKAAGTGCQTASAPAVSGPRRITAGTEQQERLWQALAKDESHICVEARAGCGKSSSSREGMWRMLERHSQLKIRYAVFNKANADEFRGQCPPGVEVGTMHSFGFAACKAAFNSQLDKSKSYLVMDDLKGGKHLARYLRTSINRLVSQAKNQGLPIPPHEDECPSEFAEYCDKLFYLALHYDIRLFGQGSRISAWAARILRRSATWTEVIDFDDMIWLPGLHGLEFAEADATFIDEDQDLNPSQHAMVPLLAGKGRVIAVGDRYQAIYSFRGADSESIPNLERQLVATPRGLATMPLTVTFRCPRSHVGLAQEYVPDLEAHASNAEGSIEHGLTVDAILARAEPGDRVICYQNAPVVKAALQLIAQRRRAVVRGRALGDQLTAVVHSCGECRTVAELTKKVSYWKAKELAHLENLDGVEDVMEAVNDRAAGLQAILSACDSPAEVEPLIRDLFAEQDQAGAIMFSTVHRAKGAEAQRIWLLDTPMKKPRRDWDEQQQRNLKYVALTRSKDLLAFVCPED